MKKKFTTIRSRITLTTITLCIFLSIAVSYISYSFYYKSVKQNMIRTAESSLTLLGSSIDSNIQDAYSFVRNCQANSFILNYLSSQGSQSARITASTYLKGSYNSYDGRYYIKRIFIASYKNRDFIQALASTNNQPFHSADDIRDLYFFDSYYSSPSYSYSEGILTTDGGSQYLPIIRPLYSQYNSDELGFIYIEMSPNVVTIPLKTAGTYQNNDFYLTLEDHSYVYSNYTLTDANPSYEITGDLSSIASFSDTIVKEISNANGKFVSISVPLAAEHCYITQLITVNTFYGQLASIIFVIVACAVITGIILHTIFNHMINHPVQELQVRMKHISEGNFERDSSIEWQHELGDIGRSINDLAEDVKTLMDQRIRDENEKREYEYKMLQSQINPHFLYNTLESITWMVEAKKNLDAVFMISELAKLLRISLSKGRTVIRISDEIQHSRSYMNIQKVRYKERFQIEFDIDEEINEYCTVKLIVQPILENAIYYGVGNMDEDDGGKITIRGEKKDDDIYISVEDNGMGMNEDIVENILKDNNKVPKHGSGVGLINVHSRIQLMFGNEYGLEVYSEPDEGTRIVIHIPAIPYTEENREQLETQNYGKGRVTDEEK